MPRVHTTPDTPLPVPFIILVDHREVPLDYQFTGIRADSAEKNRPLVVTRRIVTLKTGDYTIDGMADLVTVERKQKTDLFGTLGQERERFEREHERMAEMIGRGGYACVMIEASLRGVLLEPPERSKLNPKTIVRTFVSWQQKYGVQWIFAEDRRMGELLTFQVLKKFWDHKQREEKERTEDVAASQYDGF